MFNIDRSKAINALLYVITELKRKKKKTDLHRVMKILYFADKKHLINYGFPITGDTYLKQQFGPVPTFMNYVAKDKKEDYKGFINKKGVFLSTAKVVDLDDLSESEIGVLDSCIEEYSKFDFKTLTEMSHGFAWENTDWHISYEDMAIEGGADNNLIAFIRQKGINNKISFK